MDKIFKREKLYEQMEKFPNSIPEFDHNKLLLHLETKSCKGVLSFKNFSEFLNILNSIFFFYVIIQ